MAEKACEICGSTPVVARGWCALHYKRWWKTGNPDEQPSKVQNKGHDCSVVGCLRPAVVKGMCKMHDKRRRKGDVGPAGRIRSQSAEVCFCGLPALDNGHCAAHQ